MTATNALLACAISLVAFGAERVFADNVQLNDDECIVLLGDAFMERMQTNGYFETALHSCLPQANVKIRNLGWSGDTVDGLARAVFGSPEDGYKRLLKDTREAKPTMIVVGYGGNEAHGGVAGLETFTRKLNRLLNDLEKTGARIVLLAPTRYAQSVVKKSDNYNRKLEAYIEVLRETAAHRKYPFVNLGDRVDPGWKENGLHFSEYGYWRVAESLAASFGARRMPWSLHLDIASNSYGATNTSISDIKFGGDSVVSLRVRDRQLPRAVKPSFSPKDGDPPNRLVTIDGLEAGQYKLTRRDAVIAQGSAKEWAEGIAVRRPGSDQVAVMRQLVVAKNELYFHRYRPQNETYLFLFRKHEQGNNAVEITKFEPLVEKVDEEIQRLKTPSYYRLQLQKVQD